MEEKVINRINQLIQKGNMILNSRHEVSTLGGGSYSAINEENIPGLWTASLSFIRSVFGESHPHYQTFIKFTRNLDERNFKACLAVLQAIKEEIDAGWVTSLKGIVSAEIFTDFLEMAEHLLEENYKDPAAVMIGSVLEEHLRQLCTAKGVGLEITNPKGISIPKKADVLNADLRKADAYNLGDQKAVTNWLDLRNNAAHGKYQEYTKEQVILMFQGVQNFIVRNPA